MQAWRTPEQWRMEWHQMMREEDEEIWRRKEVIWKELAEARDERKRAIEEELGAFFAEEEEEQEKE